MKGPDTPSIVAHVTGNPDAEFLDVTHRRLRRELMDDLPDVTFTTDIAPSGAKGDIGILSGIVIPLTVASIPVIADKLHLFMASRREKCTLVLEGPNGVVLELPGIEKTEVTKRLDEWRRYWETGTSQQVLAEDDEGPT